jgi:hypothetical protein
MRKMLSAAALVTAVMMVSTTSYAETNEYSGNYTGATIGVGLWLGLGDPDLGDFGGVGFAGVEGTPISFSIADATDTDIAWTVAQDLNGDTTAGGPGEPRVTGCGKGGSLEGASPAFVEGATLIVFVRSVARVGTAGPTAEACPGLATHGTITLTSEL